MIADHYGHEIVIARYSDTSGEPLSHSIECLDCFEVLESEEL